MMGKPEEFIPELFREPAAIEPAIPFAEEGKMELIRGMREDLFLEHARILRDVARFRDLDPTAKEPPEEWVRTMGADEAAKAFRVALSGWMDQKASPVGLKLAAQVVTGAMKAMAQENQNGRALNIQFVQVINRGTPEPEFPELEVVDVHS